MTNELIQPVLVGVDGSPGSLDAVDLAAEEATARMAPLLVVHVTRGQLAANPAAHELLGLAVRRAVSDHPGLSVTPELTVGKPADVLIDRSAQAILAVVGHIGHNLLGRLVVGSVPLDLVSRAPVPVLVHRPVDIAPDGPAPPPVLVGVTGTPKDEPVIGFAFEEASLRGTTLHAMHVWSEPADAELPDIHAEVRGFSQAHEEAERMLSETLAGWSDKYPEVPVSRTVRHSLDAAVALTAASWSAQLAVVGASEDSLLAHVLSASVSHTLAHRAGCPVAVVHERQS